MSRSAMDLAQNIVNQLADLWEVPVDVRQATNDRCDDFVAGLIARVPAEPVGVSDEAVERGAEAYYDYNRYADAEPAWSVLAAKDGDEAAIYRKASRTVLEAALPHLQPQPVADRERVLEFLKFRIDAEEAGVITDGLLAAGVFLEPPTLGEVKAAIRTGLGGDTEDEACGCESHICSAADAVLNLLIPTAATGSGSLST